MSSINRRTALIELSKAGQLTPELAQQIRWQPQRQLRPLLHQAVQEPVVRLAIGLDAVTIDPAATLPSEEVQRLVNQHLAVLGLPPVSVYFLNPREALGMPVSLVWERHLIHLPRDLRTNNLPPKVARLLEMADSPAWQPLVTLIQHNIHPHGLSGGHQYFYVFDTSA